MFVYRDKLGKTVVAAAVVVITAVVAVTVEVMNQQC
jgi:hypothetical protein